MPQACRRLPRRGRKVLGASTLNPPAAVNSPANPQALHKNGQLINISLVVSRIESGGEVCFMGVIKELVDDTAVLSLDPDGVIRTMNSPAADMFGYTAMEVGPPSLRSLLPRASTSRAGSAAESGAPSVVPLPSAAIQVAHHPFRMLLTDASADGLAVAIAAAQRGEEQARGRRAGPRRGLASSASSLAPGGCASQAPAGDSQSPPPHAAPLRGRSGPWKRGTSLAPPSRSASSSALTPARWARWGRSPSGRRR